MSTSPTDLVFNKKPRNPYNRQCQPTRVGAVLATIVKKRKNRSEILCEQFPIDGDNSFYRPLVFSSDLQNNPYATPSKKTKTVATGSPFRTPEGSKKLPFTVVTPKNQTMMKTARYVDISIIDGSDDSTVQKTLFFYSPVRVEPSDNAQHKVKGKLAKETAKKKLVLDDKGPATNSQAAKSLLGYGSSISPQDIIKGGESTTIVPCKRVRRLSRIQRSVMSKSARQDILDTLEQNKKKYNCGVFKLLTTLATHFSMEWLHCLAFSLTPKGINPQRPENLGSGPSWINSYMMVLEKVALLFATKHPGAVSVKPIFRMLGESNIIDELDYEVTIQTPEKEIILHQKLKALVLPDKSNWPSCSDSVFTQLAVENELSPKSKMVKMVFPIKANL